MVRLKEDVATTKNTYICAANKKKTRIIALTAHAELLVLDSKAIVVNVVEVRACLIPSSDHRAHR
jgi:hypothetical protein